MHSGLSKKDVWVARFKAKNDRRFSLEAKRVHYSAWRQGFVCIQRPVLKLRSSLRRNKVCMLACSHAKDAGCSNGILWVFGTERLDVS